MFSSPANEEGLSCMPPVKGLEAEIRTPVAATRLTSARAMLHLLRPHHWVKNTLVLVPMLLAHLWSDPRVVRAALLAVVCFCLTASAGYIINDLVDVEADRRHATKRLRPLVAGAVSTRAAMALLG